MAISNGLKAMDAIQKILLLITLPVVFWLVMAVYEINRNRFTTDDGRVLEKNLYDHQAEFLRIMSDHSRNDAILQERITQHLIDCQREHAKYEEFLRTYGSEK